MQKATNDKQIYVTGIQPTGKLHIGNYLGVLSRFLELQDKLGGHFLFIADLHSLTQQTSAIKQRSNIVELAAELLAAGIDTKKTTLFQQSDVLEHAQLGWVFETLTTLGKLRRMTQFKDKSAHQKENINAGLLTYPALQAADILIYKATHVPVGEDQYQHLELTREIARKFNNTFSDIFPEPQAVPANAPRIMSLSDPENKMSKSSPGGCLFLDDSPEDVKKKIGSAVTDSENKVHFDPENKAGVSNLLQVYAALAGTTPEESAEELGGGGYAEFKAAVATKVIECFAEFRERKAALVTDQEGIHNTLAQGAERARPVAAKTLQKVKEKMGLVTS